MTVCVQQGGKARQPGYQHITRRGWSPCYREMSGLYRLALQSPGELSAILIIISQRNATQVWWRNCNLNKNAEKNPINVVYYVKTNVSHFWKLHGKEEQQQKIFVIKTCVLKQEKASARILCLWTMMKKQKRCFLCQHYYSSLWHSRTGEERRGEIFSENKWKEQKRSM